MIGTFSKEDLINRLQEVHYNKTQAEELYNYYERNGMLHRLIDYLVFRESTIECI